MTEDVWAAVTSRFVDHYETLYGRTRTYVLHQHLKEHLPPPPGRVVDVGGGAGHQAIPLAQEGYEVTIVDPSAEMLAAARQRLMAEPDDVQARVRLVKGTGETAGEAVGGEAFTAALCHGVVMYVDDPEPLVAGLCGLVAPGGVVSIVAKNAAALAMRPAHEGDWAAVLEAFDATHQANGLGMDTRADTVGGLSGMLARQGIEPVAWYGVRLFTEGWGRERPATDEDSAVFAAELEASQRDPYRQLSRLFHLVGRKQG